MHCIIIKPLFADVLQFVLLVLRRGVILRGIFSGRKWGHMRREMWYMFALLQKVSLSKRNEFAAECLSLGL